MDHVTRLLTYANELFATTLTEEVVDLSAPVKLNDSTGFEDPEIRNTQVQITQKVGQPYPVDLELLYNRLSLTKLVGLKNNRLSVAQLPTSVHQYLPQLSQWLGREIFAEDVEDSVPQGSGNNATLLLKATTNSYGFVDQATITLTIA